MDGYEFLTSDDNAAEADFDADYDDTTGAGYCTLNSVEFNGEDVLPRLSEDEVERIEQEIFENPPSDEWYPEGVVHLL